MSKAILVIESAIGWLNAHDSGYKPDKPEKMKSDFKLQWTADVTDLVEITMALHERRAINNGEVSITALVNFLFNLFGMKPGNFFSTYGVMRTRANSRTLFLDELKRSFENKMDRDDNKEIKQERKN
ncbi:MAG: hypothetical protein GZ094_05330 [Mariniphaga sp.]|nr:hypothetical protein [Mariniphaga sp.]